MKLLENQSETIDGEQLYCRYATMEDYAAVIKIMPNLNNGLDYMQHWYPELIKNPNKYCFLCECNGRIVRNFEYITLIYNNCAQHDLIIHSCQFISVFF